MILQCDRIKVMIGLLLPRSTPHPLSLSLTHSLSFSLPPFFFISFFLFRYQCLSLSTLSSSLFLSLSLSLLWLELRIFPPFPVFASLRSYGFRRRRWKIHGRLDNRAKLLSDSKCWKWISNLKSPNEKKCPFVVTSYT